jgi:hypothetical protein
MIDRARTMKRGTAGRDVGKTYSVYLGLRRCGLSTAEAGNLTARLEGIHAVPGGWSLRDVERLQFLRWLITSGRFGADDIGQGSPSIGRRVPSVAASIARATRTTSSGVNPAVVQPPSTTIV